MWENFGMHFRQARGIHMNEDYFELGRGTGLKFGTMMESIWIYQFV